MFVIGATNRPQELDVAMHQLFEKKLYIPLPEQAGRKALIANLLKKNNHTLTVTQLEQLANNLEGFSGADLKILCTDAAMEPLREFGAKAMEMNANDLPPISYEHFHQVLCKRNPSVAQSSLASHIEWNNMYGSMFGPCSDKEFLGVFVPRRRGPTADTNTAMLVSMIDNSNVPCTCANIGLIE